MRLFGKSDCGTGCQHVKPVRVGASVYWFLDFFLIIPHFFKMPFGLA